MDGWASCRTFLLRNNLYQLSFDFLTRFYLQQPNRNRQIEPPRPAASRIEIKHAFPPINIGRMRMPGKHGGKLGCRGIEVQRLQVVQKIEIATFKQNDLCFGQFSAWTVSIDIAANRSDGCNLLQLAQDGDFAHIAEVQDVVDPCKSRRNLRAQQAVGIADDAKLHLSRISGVRSAAGRVSLREDTQSSR